MGFQGAGSTNGIERRLGSEFGWGLVGKEGMFVGGERLSAA